MDKCSHWLAVQVVCFRWRCRCTVVLHCTCCLHLDNRDGRGCSVVIVHPMTLLRYLSPSDHCAHCCYRKKLHNLLSPPQLCPPNSPDLNAVDNSMWEYCKRRCIKYASLIWTNRNSGKTTVLDRHQIRLRVWVSSRVSLAVQFSSLSETATDIGVGQAG